LAVDEELIAAAQASIPAASESQAEESADWFAAAQEMLTRCSALILRANAERGGEEADVIDQCGSAIRRGAVVAHALARNRAPPRS
jgi:hypothetical protein